MRKQGRGIQIVEDGDIDLTRTVTRVVDYKCGCRSIALGQVAIEKLEPVMFSRRSGSGSVFEEATDGELSEHFFLYSAEDFGEVDLAGVGSAWH